MQVTGYGSMSTSPRERGQIINGVNGPIIQTTGNGTYRQSTRTNNYKTKIQSQVHSFMSRNNIR